MISKRALDESVDAAVDGVADRRERAITIHDLVRDRVVFGFTPWFDAARPRRTWELGVGLAARIQPVAIRNDILLGSPIRLPCSPTCSPRSGSRTARRGTAST